MGANLRKGIERLAYELTLEDHGDISLGELAEKHGQTVERIIDAIDVIKVKRGQPTSLPPVPWWQPMEALD